MRAVMSLVQAWLAAIGVFIVMTLSLCVAFAIAIAGPPTKSELADLRALAADAMRALESALRGDREDAPARRAEAPPLEAETIAPPPAPAPEPPRASEHGPLLGGTTRNEPPAPEIATPNPPAPRADRPRAPPAQRVAPARGRESAAAPPPAIDSRAAQIARAAEELLATLPPQPSADAAETEAASAPTDSELHSHAPPAAEAPQSYEDWAESWTPFEEDRADDASYPEEGDQDAKPKQP